jgi:hypothetical protein
MAKTREVGLKVIKWMARRGVVNVGLKVIN